jgi:hypothetical protein
VIENPINPRHVLLMHIPTGEEEQARHAPIKVHPRVVVIGKELEKNVWQSVIQS